MTLPTLRRRLRDDGFLLSSWSSLADPIVHETLLRSDFDAITFDMQHGVADVASIVAGIGLAGLAGKPALVRLAIDDRANAARFLDAGASGVIMPMIEGTDDARAFVDAVKYPPVGQRSYGPSRATSLHGYANGLAYAEAAREATLAFAMIETRTALGALADILAIDGLDGVFVGPMDLSAALAQDGRPDPRGERVEDAIRRIIAATDAADKIGAIYAPTAADARRYRSYGYRLACVGSDLGLLAAGVAALAKDARGEA